MTRYWKEIKELHSELDTLEGTKRLEKRINRRK